MIFRLLRWLLEPPPPRIRPPLPRVVPWVDDVVSRDYPVCPTAPVVKAATVSAKKPRVKPPAVGRKTPPVAVAPVSKTDGDASDVVLSAAIMAIGGFDEPSSDTTPDFSGGGGDFGGGGSSGDY